MDTARIAALLEPFVEADELNETQLNQISIYIDLLQRWNARINLTAIRNEEEIVTRHFGESFFLARHLFPGGAEKGGPEAQASGAAQSAAGSTENWASRTENWASKTEHCCQVLDIGSGSDVCRRVLENRRDQNLDRECLKITPRTMRIKLASIR